MRRPGQLGRDFIPRKRCAETLNQPLQALIQHMCQMTPIALHQTQSSGSRLNRHAALVEIHRYAHGIEQCIHSLVHQLVRCHLRSFTA